MCLDFSRALEFHEFCISYERAQAQQFNFLRLKALIKAFTLTNNWFGD